MPLSAHNFASYLDYVLVRRGRAHTMLTFEKVGGPVSAKMEQRLSALTTRRLRPRWRPATTQTAWMRTHERSYRCLTVGASPHSCWGLRYVRDVREPKNY